LNLCDKFRRFAPVDPRITYWRIRNFHYVNYLSDLTSLILPIKHGGERGDFTRVSISVIICDQFIRIYIAKNSDLVRLTVALHNFRFVRAYAGPFMLQVVSSENSFFRRTRISIATRNRSSANCYPSNRFNLAEALVACTSPFIRSTRDSDISAWTSHFVLGSPSTPHRRERESQAFEIPSASRRTRGKLRPMTRGDACRVYRKPRSAGVAEMPISGYHSRVVPPTNPVNNGRPG